MAAQKHTTTAKVTLSDNARVVLERRYLARDDDGNLLETPEQLFRRVADNIAQAEALYTAPESQLATGAAHAPAFKPGYAPTSLSSSMADRFYELMTSLRFLPNSPTLGNAGRPLQQLSACFVLPVEDSMAGIFETVKETALIHQSGGGTGFAFSRLRPAGDIVRSTGGVASGPLSFMRVFDAATEAIKQGGTRRGANMAILDVHHPDIEGFINLKADMTTLTNFNISVAVDADFMRAVEAAEDYDLINPRTGLATGRLNARRVFDQIVANAWRNGDPGLVFLDRINRDHPTPALGAIEATNPCGEQPLLPYESCNLGSINLSRFALEEDINVAATFRSPNGIASSADPASKDARPEDHPEPVEGRAPNTPSARPEHRTEPAEVALEGHTYSDVQSAPHAPAFKPGYNPNIQWDALAETVDLAVRFLDDVIDMNAYPVEAIDRMTKLTRKIGLGVMGWADLLFKLGIPYDSEQALALAGEVMGFIREKADAASTRLAAERGVFPAWPESIYGLEGANQSLRNSTRTTIAPTGTLSIIADCTGGIEPAFSLAFTRQHYLDPSQPSQPVRLTEVNHVFEAAAHEAAFYSQELMDYLAEGGSLATRPEVPEWAKQLFVTSHDIAPEWHVRMQAAFQHHTDNAVSKTINFPREATIEDVAAAYLMAYREGCKGITIYRDGSRTGQVLSHIADGEGYVSAEDITSARPEALEGPGGDERGDLVAGFLLPVASEALHRRRLLDERQSITHKFRVGEQEGYVTVGLFEDGTPGEIFVTIAKEGSTIRGLMDSVAMLTSYSLQYGVALETLVNKFRGVHFEPAGFTANPQIPQATSLVDYIFRWLELKFPPQNVNAQDVAATFRSPQDEASSRDTASKQSTFEDHPEPVEGRSPEGRNPNAPSAHPEALEGHTTTRGFRDAQTRRRGRYVPPSPALPFKDIATGLLCPDCGSQLIFNEGCLTCRSCGYTKCG